MRLRPLTRLRLYFFALGAVLLAPLGFLLSAMDDRVQAQRRLRHEVVAERIFDELERELTLVLESEALRPSSAYEAATRIEAWAPFVVGYVATKYSFYSAFLFLAGAFFLGAILALALPETKGQQLD